ncbi:MAG: TonB-dependent receptor plug domain-containing protein [Rhizobiales bacterium]|nr:TonB-dependent receptor plug domain-containing protein [Hyphomicrobiales bacterium]
MSIFASILAINSLISLGAQLHYLTSKVFRAQLCDCARLKWSSVGARSRRAVVCTASATLLLAGTAPSALAQVLDEITVTATRADRPVSDVPQSMQVVNREEIQAQLEMTSNPSVVLSKLIPGFSVSNQTISGASESFRGRDLLVMIDGVPLNTPLRDVARIVSLIDLNAVERIEVVAGASSLYGSGATGGTVNFITRRAAEGKPTIGLNTWC